MPRPPRVHLEDVIYYVTLEGPYQEPVFRDAADYQKYLELLGRYKKEYGFKLFSYALLPNHIHLLIEANEEFPISTIMQKITPLYTKYFNARHERKGPLFQKRFRSVIVEKETHLPDLTRYVHMTPSRSGLTQNLNEYSYSSYPAYLQSTPSPFSLSPRGGEGRGEGGLDLREEVSQVTRFLPDPKLEDAYERYVRSAKESELEFLDKKLSRGFILGSEAFEQKIREHLKDYSHKEAVLPKGADPVPAAEGAVAIAFTLPKRMLVLSGLLACSVFVSAYALYLNRGLVPVKPMGEAPSFEKTKINAPKPVDLSGTVWEVALVAVAKDGTEQQIKDRIRFTGKSFESYYFSNQGFSRSNYSVTVNEGGVITWETIQRNEKGETVSWRGDWRGDRMEGIMSYHPTEKTGQDFSFLSSRLAGQSG